MACIRLLLQWQGSGPRASELSPTVACVWTACIKAVAHTPFVLVGLTQEKLLVDHALCGLRLGNSQPLIREREITSQCLFHVGTVLAALVTPQPPHQSPPLSLTCLPAWQGGMQEGVNFWSTLSLLPAVLLPFCYSLASGQK